MDDGRRLAELFVALFTTERELRRFLQAELPAGTAKGRKSAASESVSHAAPQIATSLVAEGAVTAELFDALEERFPARAADIALVRDTYLREPVTRRLSADLESLPVPVPTKYAAVLADLSADLDALELPPDDGELATTSPDHWPWAAAAAVLGSFRPLALRPLPGTAPSVPALDALVDLVLVGHQGLWRLRDDVRAPCLRRLWDDQLLGVALRANQEIDDSRRTWLDALHRGLQPSSLAQLDPRQLDDLDVVLGWLQPLEPGFTEYRVAVQAAVERRILIDPLRALVGRHFRGRTRELAIVTSYLGPTFRAAPTAHLEEPDPVLVITGPGGSGKSTLVGKLLLDLEDSDRWHGGRLRPFAYIDFDKARHDPRSPRALLEQVARQLQLLYATAEEASNPWATLEAAYSPSAAGSPEAAELRTLIDSAQGHSVEVLVHLLAQTLEVFRADDGFPPLVLVFDTFEEVIRKGPGAVADVWSLIDALRAELHDLRIIVAGRGVVAPAGHVIDALELGDLDPDAADAVLAQLGVGDPRLRRLVVEQYGGNPLTLHLAADVIARTESADEAFGGIERQADVLAEVAQEQVQGMLYSRILGHLKDDDVVKVAHPGLVVRRVTVPVLQEVLATPCRFDPAEAADLFERLRAEVTMFELDGDALRHRQDVRRLMLGAIYADPRRTDQVAEIHRRAIAYYSRANDRTGRAELLYHRLMAGESPRELDRLWTPDLRDLLDSALDEPLQPAARTWLTRRVRDLPGSDRADWEQADWEAAAEQQASSWLASSNPGRAVAVLRERTERLSGSRLYPLEVAARLALDDASGAADVLQRGMTDALQARDRSLQLALAEQAIHVHAARGDWPGIVEAAAACGSLADLLGVPDRGITALTTAVGELRALGKTTAAESVCATLVPRFTRLRRDELLARPQIVRNVLQIAGPVDGALLRHVATEAGDTTDDDTGIFASDPFVLARLLDGVTPAGREAVARLAAELDVSAAGDTLELASRAVRAGRTGKAVTIGLDHAADPAAARELVAGSLVRQPGPN